VNPLSARAIHEAGFADPRSSHREKQSPGCGCYWCSPGPCNLCGLAHTNPSVTDGCLDHALRTAAR
jgi:hypothetical protein